MLTTVAIPISNGMPALDEVLAGVRRQVGAGEIELLVCDSGSHDGSLETARDHGAQIIQIRREEFGHGRTRNLLMSRSRGEHVAFLTQDAVPDGERWLAQLLHGFELTEDVGLVFGPYRPRADASPMVSRELSEWFAGFSDGASPRVDRVTEAEAAQGTRQLLGRRGFFTDANGCVSRVAWERVSFRNVAYAEDQLLALDMMRAGFAKVFVPDAPVIHSHSYSLRGWLSRSFDEARGLEEVYGWTREMRPRPLALELWGTVGADLRWARRGGTAGPALAQLAGRSLAHHLARTTGALLGGRHRRLPRPVVVRLSAERRA
jgi:rhamnosyltransferase